MLPPNPGVSSRSGITTNAETGERYIPSSLRADGSRRREIRVRPGYRPPEDVEVYKNRAAEAWKNRGKGGVPGAEGLSSEEDKITGPGTAAANKNAKRREARRKAKQATGGHDEQSNNLREDGEVVESGQIPVVHGSEKSKIAGEENEAAVSEEQPDPDVEKEKKARNLKKKLRQAKDLRDKKDSGEVLLPEQLEKVIKISELIRQLDVLGFNANGENKAAARGQDSV